MFLNDVGGHSEQNYEGAYRRLINQSLIPVLRLPLEQILQDVSGDLGIFS
jgi:hypothetical protein